ncbi:hypothetical protein GCM10007036_13890 [Alsobacter metallidurans]|uniref:Uncharacterized protein n=1 Tax=Alsobacter metallidurans TaxID=340221 RepID=A0A917I5I1_9HYPH|nr:hypothetical protein [Alsobacter metallidurans]GGH14521.1 hypothetical protein GCM10007036_13890 [Alsobacter metallidurans]
MAPLPFRWDGEVMQPLPGFARKADRLFVIGQFYDLDNYEDRSAVSHKHEFAWLREAWKNLPEQLADLYPTPEHLRKRALIEAGYYDEVVVDAGSAAAALRVRQAFAAVDDFALVIVRGPLVIRRTAKSQSRRAMDGKTFQQSKQAIMDVVAEMVGVTTKQLQQNVDKAA